MSHEELPTRGRDPALSVMHWILRIAAYAMAVAMVVVIIEGVVGIIMTVYRNLAMPPWFFIPDIVATFGAFLAVLIAYEIFANITLYIRSDVFPVKLVLATALMAVARKVIVMDDYTPGVTIGIGILVLGLGLGYWLIAFADARAGWLRQSEQNPEDLMAGTAVPKADTPQAPAGNAKEQGNGACTGVWLR